MNRREALAGLGLLALAPRARGQGRIRRIGYLLLAPLAEKPSPERLAFLEGLRGYGYVEGRNLKIEYRSAELEADFLPDLAADLGKAGVELIFAVEGSSVRAAVKALPAMPVVFVSIVDPVEAGFARSLARPGRTVTGITLLGVNLAPKRLELLHQLLPRARRIAVLQGHPRPGSGPEWNSVKPAAAKRGLELEPHAIADSAEFPRTLEQIARSRPDGLFILTNGRTIGARRIIADFALAHRLPSVMGFPGYARAGGLASLAPKFTEQFGRAAAYVDKILKGARPGDLPIEQPERLELVLNLKTARALGLSVPQSVLLRADEAIQ